MHGRARRPFHIAVPLDQVDFAAADRVVIEQPPGRPGPRRQAIELHPRLEGVVDRRPECAYDLPADVLAIALPGGANDQVAIAIEEHMLTVIPVLTHILRAVPEHRVLDQFAPLGDLPEGGVGGRPGRAVELVTEECRGCGRRRWRARRTWGLGACRVGHGRPRRKRYNSNAQAGHHHRVTTVDLGHGINFKARAPEQLQQGSPAVRISYLSTGS